jgi:type I restriction enzyme, S subunit
MRSDWQLLQLGELGDIVTGKTPSTKVPEYFDGDIPFVTPTDMDDRKVISKTERYLTQEGTQVVGNSYIPKGSIMVSCIGSQMGKVAIAGRDCVTNQQINSIIVDREWCGDFVYYNLSARQEELRGLASGSAVPILNKGHFSEVEISLPLLPEQRAIAHILGSLDDKIELNRRMNATLEGIALALFKSWFVDFDPVHARRGERESTLPPEVLALFPADFEESELGLIPRGWRISTLGNLVRSIKERVRATPEKDSEMYVALQDMPSRSIDLSQFRPGSEVNSSIIKFKKGDILFGSMRPYFHKVGFAQFDGITRTTTFVLRPKTNCMKAFALLNLSSDDVIDYSTTASVGTTIPYIKWPTLAKYPICLPPMDLLREFENTLRPMLNLIKSNSSESRTLAELRDTLLPRLISGELRIPEAYHFIQGG